MGITCYEAISIYFKNCLYHTQPLCINLETRGFTGEHILFFVNTVKLLHSTLFPLTL